MTKEKPKTARERAKSLWMRQMRDLRDRWGIKQGFYDIDDSVMEELNETQIGYITKAIEEAEQRVIAEMEETFNGLREIADALSEELSSLKSEQRGLANQDGAKPLKPSLEKCKFSNLSFISKYLSERIEILQSSDFCPDHIAGYSLARWDILDYLKEHAAPVPKDVLDEVVEALEWEEKRCGRLDGKLKCALERLRAALKKALGEV